MKKMILTATVAILTAISATAQTGTDNTTVHSRLPEGCMHTNGTTRAGALGRKQVPQEFDPLTTYRQPVLLVEFSNMKFSMSNPAEYYNRLFNEPGYNEGAGPGCVADYFREQSAGRLNIAFDIYGPVKIRKKAGEHNQALEQFGSADVKEATGQLRLTDKSDFSIYNWNGDEWVNQLVVVFAGYTGNNISGYIYPNTGYLDTKLPGGVTPKYVSISCERWKDGSLCGIGTIVHEFCHCLGLPDIYPMQPATAYSAVDEWDLMDGGNYTGKGWCPPNLTAMERMYLGWSTPVELTEPKSIKSMKPLSEGGETFIVRNTANPDEYYLLENRRQKGWDYGVPGNGLLISHVDFDQFSWTYNLVNTSDNHSSAMTCSMPTARTSGHGIPQTIAKT